MSEQAGEMVTHCIDAVLDQLGVNCRRAIVLHIRRESGLKRYEILEKPAEFIKALRSVLGQASIAIEREIIDNLEKELKIEHKENQDLLSLLTEIKGKTQQGAQIKKLAEVVHHDETENHRVYMDYMKK